jgi:hypothetical protein
VAEQNAWLVSYMDSWYFWYALSPRPSAAGYTTVDSYFQALLYTGSDVRFPRDRWSGSESTETYNRFFGDGATLGYGLAVTGVEAAGDATRPLYIRYVEPGSPADAQGVRRGDLVQAVNGRSAASLVAGGDYSVLTPAAAGDVLTLALRRGGVDRTVSLSAAIYNLNPVQGAAVQTTAGGRKLGVVTVTQMLSQALTPLDSAFAGFKSAGVDDLVLDLRYNGGGLVSVGATLASYVAGQRGAGLSYATLLFNDKRASASNVSYPFSDLGAALGLPRVFALVGPRTCSASEQVINGLRGAGIQVVAIGATTCGKPVGFQPTSNCGRTYSVVNFESVNKLGQGRYFDGLTASCPVAEDFTAAQNGAEDPLLNAARRYADSGQCPASAGQAQAAAARLRAHVDDGGRQGMLIR